MRYSVSTDSVYCVYCALFSPQRKDSKDQTFVSSPVCDWSNMSKLSQRHVKEGANHYSCVTMGENFLKVARGEQLCVADQFIPIRGHSEEDSNFTAILRHHAQYSPLMAHHLAHANPCMKYTSPDVQNELIRLCGLAIRDPLVKACNTSLFYGFIADEATDVATIEQIAICTRYLARNDATLRLEITEEFLGFVEADKTTGEALAITFINAQEEYGILVAKMRSQGYDGAANMAGIHRGVQARIRQLVPGAIYTHCKAHNINLAIVHASREPLIRTMMETVQQIAFSFNYSAKRLHALQAQLELDGDARAAMNKRTKLQSLCETRWTSRANALYTFKSALTVVVTALEYLATDGDGKARSYAISIQKFDFIVTLVTVEHVLQSLLPLTTFLQAKQCDLLEAAKEATTIVSLLKEQRADPTAWDTLFDNAVDLAAKFNVEASKPRNAGRQVHCENVPADTPSQYWKRAMYLPFMDHLLQELDTRLLVAQDRYVAPYIIPSQLTKLTPQRITQLYESFKDDMPGDQGQVESEVARWKARWQTVNVEEKPNTLDDSIQEINPDLYPNLYAAVVILMVMPVSTATAERSFSAMRRLKNYLRSTMTTERLSGLALMHVHKNKPLDAARIVQQFSQQKNRRLALVFRP